MSSLKPKQSSATFWNLNPSNADTHQHGTSREASVERHSKSNMKSTSLLLAALLLCSCASTAPRPVAQRTTSFEKQTLVGEAPAPVSDKERDE
jgi:hypothetical protein